MPMLDTHASTESLAADLEEQLVGWLHAAGSVLIGFSGGVDSAYLACVAVEALGAEHVLAVIGRSSSYPEVQWTRARDLAEQFGIPLLEVDTDELQDPRYAANPTNRCYFCKSELWHVLSPIARERGLAVVIDGTNAEDLTGHRPGAAAAREQGVRSPLAEVGMTKAAIRERSRAREIPTWNQPASPCLSSRIPYGTEVTPERLRLVERAEAALRALGIRGDMRVRLHGPLARIELAEEELDYWSHRDRLHDLRDAVVTAGFERAALDLRGFRSGSLNRVGAAERNENVGEWSDVLESEGEHAPVESIGGMAVITERNARQPWTAERRAAAVSVGSSHGFTHVALELHATALDTALLRAQPPARESRPDCRQVGGLARGGSLDRVGAHTAPASHAQVPGCAEGRNGRTAR